MQDVVKNTKERMQHSIEATERDFQTVRTGRATPALLDRVKVEYYGSEMPVNQVATVSVPEPRQLLISPWDKSVLPAITKAIHASDLGLTPNSDGSTIRLEIPTLTEERRKELTKMVHHKAEEGKVAIRNVRRDANEHLDKREKAKEISEDDVERGKKEIQKLTDEFIARVDEITAKKVEEIMEV
ncbi:ribosome recycling factor [bacterium]|nr:ribosome recycling factor [bacterium]